MPPPTPRLCAAAPRPLLVAALLAPLLLAGGAAAAAEQANVLELRHHVLMLTNKDVNGWSLGFMKSILGGYDIPFTVVLFGPDAPQPPPADLDALLWQTKGRVGRFSAVVMYPDLEHIGTLPPPQAAQLRSYVAATGARVLKWGVWGSELAHTPVAIAECSTGLQGMQLVEGGVPLGLSGVNPKAPLTTEGIYRCPGLEGRVQDSTCVYPRDGSAAICQRLASAPVPFLRLLPNTSLGAVYAQPTVAGALLKYADGRQVMSFALDCSEAFLPCFALGHIAASWLLQDIIPGQRRSLLSLQIDDVFLPTRLYEKTERYRMTSTDVTAHMAWQADLNSRLPKGSNVKLDMVFNGNGVLEKVYSPLGAKDSTPCHDTPLYKSLGCACFGKTYAACPAGAPPFCRNCTKDWRKPLGGFGTGTTVGPHAQWDAAQFLAGYDVYKLVSTTDAAKDAFYWTSHMFSHQVLDNTTYEGVATQIKWNKVMAGKGFLGISSRPVFTSKVVVPPQVSGLTNGDCLRAMADNGVRAVIGDNTWQHMLNPDSAYRIHRTAKDQNGYEGVAILPRWSTALYYDTSTADELTGAHNRQYPPPAGGAAKTLADVVAADARRVVLQGLLPLRMDGFMFHQANLRVTPLNGPSPVRNAAFQGRSLVMAWTEAVLDLLGQYVTWPVKSLSLDDIESIYSALEARDACQITYTLRIARGANGGGGGGTVRAVTLRSAAAPGAGAGAGAGAAGAAGGGPTCQAPLTVRRGVSLSGGERAVINARQAVGDEPRVFSIRFPKGGASTIRLTSESKVRWNA